MKNVYRRLTVEQKRRGVIMSSKLIGTSLGEDFEGTEHEVLNTDPDYKEKMDRLKDASFFDESPYHTNIIRY